MRKEVAPRQILGVSGPGREYYAALDSDLNRRALRGLPAYEQLADSAGRPITDRLDPPATAGKPPAHPAAGSSRPIPLLRQTTLGFATQKRAVEGRCATLCSSDRMRTSI